MWSNDIELKSEKYVSTHNLNFSSEISTILQNAGIEKRRDYSGSGSVKSEPLPNQSIISSKGGGTLAKKKLNEKLDFQKTKNQAYHTNFNGK